MKNDFEILPNGTVKIFLTQGQTAIIDLKDLKKISKHRWYAVKSPRASKLTYYAQTAVTVKRKQKHLKMHVLINKTPKGFLTDHRNGDTLDNTRKNLRTATNAQNQRNSPVYRNNTSGFKGVSWATKAKKWIGHIRVNGKNKTLGYFTDKLDAAKAYNQAAREYHGEFARLNPV